MDKPVTDKELDQFYGVEATEIEIAQTIGAAAAEFDAGELADIAYINFERIAEEIANGHAANIGDIIIQARKRRIADMASMAIYGRVGVIDTKHVKV